MNVGSLAPKCLVAVTLFNLEINIKWICLSISSCQFISYYPCKILRIRSTGYSCFRTQTHNSWSGLADFHKIANKVDLLYSTDLIHLLLVQMEHLTRTCRRNFFVDFVSNMIPVITVSSEHKHHLGFVKAEESLIDFSEINRYWLASMTC